MNKRKSKGVFVTIPSRLMQGFLSVRGNDIVSCDVVNGIIDYSIYTEQARTNKTLPEVYQALAIHVADPANEADEAKRMQRAWRHGKELFEENNKPGSYNYTKSTFQVPLSRLFDLRDNENGFLSSVDAICQLMYWALGSIQGNAEYQKTNDMFLLARMAGNDKPEKVKQHTFKDGSKAKQKHDAKLATMSQRQIMLAGYKMQDEFRNIGTRRKMARYKKLLSRNYHVAFYSKARGFYFSTRLDTAELAKKVEALKVKKPFKKRAP